MWSGEKKRKKNPQGHDTQGTKARVALGIDPLSLCFKCGIWRKLGKFTISASHSLEVKPTTFVLFSGPFPFPANGPVFPTLLSGLDPPAGILSDASFLNPLLQQSASQKSALENDSTG